MIASITIRFGSPHTIEEVIATLLSDGWIFPLDIVRYDYYKRPEHVGRNQQKVPRSNWSEIVKELDNKLLRKHIVQVVLDFPQDQFFGEFTFFSPYELQIPFFGCQPRLKGCSLYTSYTPLLEAIVCPLAKAQLSVLEVKCEDQND